MPLTYRETLKEAYDLLLAMPFEKRKLARGYYALPDGTHCAVGLVLAQLNNNDAIFLDRWAKINYASISSLVTGNRLDEQQKWAAANLDFNGWDITALSDLQEVNDRFCDSMIRWLPGKRIGLSSQEMRYLYVSEGLHSMFKREYGGIYGDCDNEGNVVNLGQHLLTEDFNFPSFYRI